MGQFIWWKHSENVLQYLADKINLRVRHETVMIPKSLEPPRTLSNTPNQSGTTQTLSPTHHTSLEPPRHPLQHTTPVWNQPDTLSNTPYQSGTTQKRQCYPFIIIIIKRICRVPIYRTKWEHRALFNKTNNTHTHTRTHTRTSDGGGGGGDRPTCEKV